MNRSIWASIIFSFGVFFIMAFVVPQYSAIKSFKEEISSRQAVLDSRTNLVGNVKRLSSQIASRQSDIDKITNFIPADRHADQIILSVQKMAEQSGLQLTGITVSEDKTTTSEIYKKVGVALDLVGTYSAFTNFLKLEEQSLRIYDAVKVDAAIANNLPGSLNILMSMNAYHIK